MKEPREEHYFLINKWDGEVKLGNPELSYQNRNNVYRPEWIDINNIMNLKDLVPEIAVIELLKKLK